MGGNTCKYTGGQLHSISVWYFYIQKNTLGVAVLYFTSMHIATVMLLMRKCPACGCTVSLP